MALIDAQKYKISKSKILECGSVREVRHYLISRGISRDELDDILRQRRKTKTNGRFWSATVEKMVDLCFDPDEVEIEEPESTVLEEVLEQPAIIERKQLRKGIAWMEFKSKAKDYFQPNLIYKSVDEFASYATEKELEELINKLE
jgi:hypothetical protein